MAEEEYKNAVAQAESTTKLNTALLIAGLTLASSAFLHHPQPRWPARGEPGYAAEMVREVAAGNLAIDIRTKAL